MLFWVIAGGLALAVGGLLLGALLGSREGGAPAAAYDMQVYRDQLAEVERDLARGVVAEDEAGRVRLEVSRRLLEADKAATGARKPGSAPRGLSRAGAVAIAVVVCGAGGLYAWLGAPGYPDLPLKQRIADADAARATRPAQAEAEASIPAYLPPEGVDPKFTELMEKLRAAVAANPDDLRGQQLLSGNEARLGNFAAAHAAQQRVVALKGDAVTADDFAGYGDMLIMAAGGYVSPEAEAALNRALELDPRNGPARYYTGLMYLQTGRPDLAFRIWRALLGESRPEAPWVPPITAQIERVAQLAGVRYVPPVTGPALSGPSSADMQAAAEMSPEDRQAMIRSMVDGLAERLASEGGPPEEWARLITALGVLGDTARAGAIWTEAQTVFAAAPAALATIRTAAENAGVAN
ncbi:MAG: c-type cytochrome biogenesis protein CcmI [Rhodobacter sp.]|nr:c-type cytochrome biogenesis protein CcmI [Rhodobacter sp.]